MRLHLLTSLLLILLIGGSLSADEVKTLKGDVHKGTVLSVSTTEVRLRADREMTLTAAEIIGVELLLPPRALPPTPYLRIRLVDGTLLRAHAFSLAGKEATVHLFSGLTLKFPAGSLHWVLCDAHDPRQEAEFEELLRRNLGQDQLRLLSRDGQAINVFDGFIGDADTAGETLSFTPEASAKVDVAIARVRGLIFARKLDQTAPKAVCKAQDNFGNVFNCHQVSQANGSFSLHTPAGLTLDMPVPFVQRFDFSLGKLAYLSDLDPVRLEESPILADLWHYRRDKNLEGAPLSLGGQTYAKGLALHSKTVIEYDVEGYSSFRCLVGIDENVQGPAHAIIKLEADGQVKLLEQAPPKITSTDAASDPTKQKKAYHDVNLDIRGAKRLRITVDYGEDLDLGDHVIFADARVVK
jgi:hypothetical protein